MAQVGQVGTAAGSADQVAVGVLKRHILEQLRPQISEAGMEGLLDLGESGGWMRDAPVLHGDDQVVAASGLLLTGRGIMHGSSSCDGGDMG